MTVLPKRRRSGMRTRDSCTRRFRKRGDSRSSSETSRKTKSSSGCSSGTRLNDNYKVGAGCGVLVAGWRSCVPAGVQLLLPATSTSTQRPACSRLDLSLLRKLMPTIYPPYVIERSSRGERTYDIFSRLLMDRIVFLGTPINDDVANIVIAQLLFLDADQPGREINMYINSPGGSVS